MIPQDPGAWCQPSLDVPESPMPQPQAGLPQMLEIAWSAGPPMPQGLQDNTAALVDGYLVSVAGFCSGIDGDWKPGVYQRGFLNKAWALDLSRPERGWEELPPLPGAPRQGMYGEQVDEALHLWGGFSYTEPFTYSDGFRLSRRNDA